MAAVSDQKQKNKKLKYQMKNGLKDKVSSVFDLNNENSLLRNLYLIGREKMAAVASKS